MRIALTAAIAVLLLAASSADLAAEERLTVTSTAFKDGGQIPKDQACRRRHGGGDKSPALAWSGAPAATKAFVIIVDDPDAQSVAGHTWVHWNAFNIPPTTTSIAATASGSIDGAVVTRNHNKKAGYSGMCPPNGRHKYYFAVYALDGPIADPPSAITRQAFEQRYRAKILAKGEISGVFG